MKRKVISSLMIILILAAIISGCTPDNAVETPKLNNDKNIVEVPSLENDLDELSESKDHIDVPESEPNISEGTEVKEDEVYSTPEEVAEYIHRYNQLPKNFITKKEAEKLGWISSKGNLWDVTDKMSIGGDGFGNREGLLPKIEGRKYFECDANYEGGFRGSERIVYSNDGLIFYTKDHYKTFEQLY